MNTNDTPLSGSQILALMEIRDFPGDHYRHISASSVHPATFTVLLDRGLVHLLNQDPSGRVCISTEGRAALQNACLTGTEQPEPTRRLNSAELLALTDIQRSPFLHGCLMRLRDIQTGILAVLRQLDCVMDVHDGYRVVITDPGIQALRAAGVPLMDEKDGVAASVPPAEQTPNRAALMALKSIRQQASEAVALAVQAEDYAREARECAAGVLEVAEEAIVNMKKATLSVPL